MVVGLLVVGQGWGLLWGVYGFDCLGIACVVVIDNRYQLVRVKENPRRLAGACLGDC